MDAPLFSNEFVSTSRLIYTPSDFARENLLYLQEAGSLSALKAFPSGRKNLNSYLFFLVTEGKGEIRYRENGTEKAAEIKKGDCVFIDCMDPYSHTSAPSELWSLQWVHFTGSAMPALYQKYRKRGGTFFFSPKAPERYHTILEYIYRLAGSDSYVRDMEIAAQLTTLLAYLMEDAWQKKDEPHKPDDAPKRKRVTEIKAYIDENFHQGLGLEELSRRFFIDKYYLAKTFKGQYGVTVNSYIAQTRITKAKALLRFSGDTVEEIGRKVGIEDPNYFSRIFKRVEGVSPKKYRENWYGLKNTAPP